MSKFYVGPYDAEGSTVTLETEVEDTADGLRVLKSLADREQPYAIVRLTKVVKPDIENVKKVKLTQIWPEEGSDEG